MYDPIIYCSASSSSAAVYHSNTGIKTLLVKRAGSTLPHTIPYSGVMTPPSHRSAQLTALCRRPSSDFVVILAERLLYFQACRGGGTGRRAGLKIRWW